MLYQLGGQKGGARGSTFVLQCINQFYKKKNNNARFQIGLRVRIKNSQNVLMMH